MNLAIFFCRKVTDPSTDAAVDDGGNLYVTGGFCDGTSIGTFFGFNGTTLSTGGGGGKYLAKFDGQGSMLWVQQISSVPFLTLDELRISALHSGGCLVTGGFNGIGSFGASFFIAGVGIGGIPLISKGKKDIFITKV
jgi:hypothetical protein